MSEKTTLTPEKAAKILHDHDDLEMIRHPELWPHHHVLPLRRRGRSLMDDDSTGFIFADSLFCVYTGTMYLCDRLTAKSQHYDSIEAMLADGWMVD